MTTIFVIGPVFSEIASTVSPKTSAMQPFGSMVPANIPSFESACCSSTARLRSVWQHYGKNPCGGILFFLHLSLVPVGFLFCLAKSHSRRNISQILTRGELLQEENGGNVKELERQLLTRETIALCYPHDLLQKSWLDWHLSINLCGLPWSYIADVSWLTAEAIKLYWTHLF